MRLDVPPQLQPRRRRTGAHRRAVGADGVKVHHEASSSISHNAAILNREDTFFQIFVPWRRQGLQGLAGEFGVGHGGERGFGEILFLPSELPRATDSSLRLFFGGGGTFAI